MNEQHSLGEAETKASWRRGAQLSNAFRTSPDTRAIQASFESEFSELAAIYGDEVNFDLFFHLSRPTFDSVEAHSH